MPVSLEHVECSVSEDERTFSVFDYRSWFWWKYRRFKVSFAIPAKEPFEVAECFGIPPKLKSDGSFECTLLTTFKESTKRAPKRNSFYIDIACPTSAGEIVFTLAVQVKHSVHVSL